jgi:hypothetical protein
MNLNFGDTLSRAWKITWGNKILWLFGVLAILGQGGGGGNQGVRFDAQDFRTGPSGFPNMPPEFQRFVQTITDLGDRLVPIVIALVCVGLLLSIALFLLSILGRGGLIGGAQLANANGRVSFGEAWGSGLRSFGRLFLIRLIIALPVIVLIVLAVMIGVGAAVMTAAASDGDALPAPLALIVVCVVPLICATVILSIFLSIVGHFAQFAAVLEDQSALAALRRGWGVFVANFGSSFVLGLILLVISWIVGLILALPFVLVVVPPMIGLLTGDDTAFRSGFLIAVLCFVGYLPILLVARGLLETWFTSAWTLAYQHFVRPAIAPDVQAPLPVTA